MKTYGSVTDDGGQTYKTVVIGTQTWMAGNLNYNPGTGNSSCYKSDTDNCTTYGRLYNWGTAMAGQSKANSRGICPSGWHVPSDADWDKLMRYVDGDKTTISPYESLTAGMYLKAKDRWNSSSVTNLDIYGFSALPGGHGTNASSFSDVGDRGNW